MDVVFKIQISKVFGPHKNIWKILNFAQPTLFFNNYNHGKMTLLKISWALDKLLKEINLKSTTKLLPYYLAFIMIKVALKMIGGRIDQWSYPSLGLAFWNTLPYRHDMSGDTVMERWLWNNQPLSD